MGGSTDNAFDLCLAGIGIMAYGFCSLLADSAPDLFPPQKIGLFVMLASSLGAMITLFNKMVGGYSHTDFSLLLETGFFAVGLMWYKFQGATRPIKGMEALFLALALACSIGEAGDALDPNPNVKDADQSLAMLLIVVTATGQFMLDVPSPVGAVAWLLFGEWLLFTAMAVWMGESRDHGYGMAHFSVLVLLHCIGGAMLLPGSDYDRTPGSSAAENSPLKRSQELVGF